MVDKTDISEQDKKQEQKEQERIAASKRLLAILSTIESRCRSHAAGLPKEAPPEENWEGIMFQIAGRCYATLLTDVIEILNYPTVVTKVPGTKIWIVGIANVRGNLLPIVDLQAFLLNRPTIRGRRSRVLVVNHDGLYSGLLVDPFVTTRHFYISERIDQHTGPQIPEAIERYVDAIYSYKPIHAIIESSNADINVSDTIYQGSTSDHLEMYDQNCGTIPVSPSSAVSTL